MNNSATIRTYTYTANLSRSTHEHLDDFLNQQTLLWNGALQERIEAYEKGVDITLYGKERTKWEHGWKGQMPSLTEIRRDDEWFNQYQCVAQRSILIRLDKAFQNFFRRVKNGEKPGFPKFKSSRRKVRSFETDSFNLKRRRKWNTVSIKGVGKFRFKGELQGRVKMVRVVKTARRVKIQLTTEMPAGDNVVDERAPIGIDLGIDNVVAISNGVIVEGEPLDRRKKKLNKKKHLQRKVARAKRGSNSRKKAMHQLSKECQRLTEREHGRLHELSARIIKEFSSNLILEDLNIPNMTKKGNRKSKKGLNRSVLEQKWGGLIHMLSYKAESAGGMMLKVPPHYTSQTCSVCFKKPDMKIGLNERTYQCRHCGHEEDRDVNAAKNILRAGWSGSLGGRPDAPGRIEIQEGSSKRIIQSSSGGHPTGQNSIQWSGYHCI